MSRSAVISNRAADKLSRSTAKFARIATSGFEVFHPRYTQLTLLWPTLRNGVFPGNLASKERFPLATVNGFQKRKNANQRCGFEDVMTEVSKPHMMFLNIVLCTFGLERE